MAVTADCGNAHAERHDERYRHGPGGHAARVKRHSKEIFGNKGGQHKYNGVQCYQQRRQRHTEQHTQQRDNKESPHTGGNRKDQHQIGHRRHLVGQYL